MTRAAQNDFRKRIGARVSALACMIRNEGLAKSRYGSLAPTKMVNGIVTDIVQEPTKQGGKPQTMITASFDFGNDEVVSSKLHINNIKPPVEEEGPQPVDNPADVTAMVAPIDATATATIEAGVINGEFEDDTSHQRSPSHHIGHINRLAVYAAQQVLDAPQNAIVNNLNHTTLNIIVNHPPIHTKPNAIVNNQPIQQYQMPLSTTNQSIHHPMTTQTSTT
jgi:hypothetical protein